MTTRPWTFTTERDLVARMAELSQLDGTAFTIAATPFQLAMRGPSSQAVRRILTKRYSRLRGRLRAKVAHWLCSEAARRGDLRTLERFRREEDPRIRAAVTGACVEKPPDSKTAAWLVELACHSLQHSSPDVRGAACISVMTLCGWREEVGAAVEPVCRCVADEDPSVRQWAAYACGHLAKRGYDVSGATRGLARSASERDSVASSATWALAQLAKRRVDIRVAVPALVKAVRDLDLRDPGVARNAGAALREYARAGPTALERVWAPLRKSRSGVHPRARRAVEAIARLARHPSP